MWRWSAGRPSRARRPSWKRMESHSRRSRPSERRLDMGRRAHKPDAAQRRQVEAMAAYGIPADDISRVLGVDAKTLRKHYRDELDLGETKANAQVAGFLFNSARSGNVTAQIFWLKTRAKWRETPLELRHSGSIGRKDLSELSDEELMEMIQTLGTGVGLTSMKTIDVESDSSGGAPSGGNVL